MTATGNLTGALAEEGITTDETTVLIATKAKGSGKLAIQPKEDEGFRWAEPVLASFSVTESTKDVVVLSAKTVNMNVEAVGSDITNEGETITVTANGQAIEDLPEGTSVSADLSKISGKGITIEGIDEDGKVTASELTVNYGENVTKGTYKVKFTCGNGNATLTIKVVDKDLAKAVKMTVKSKMDVTKHQKMVIVPTPSTVGGAIDEEVTIDSEAYEAVYYPASNKIVVSPADDDWTKVSAGKFDQKLTVTVAGIPRTIQVKSAVTAAKPSVKIGKVTFAKAAFPGKTEDGTFTALEGETNVLATYKMNGKTFSMEPAENGVKFTNGTASTEEDGYFLDSKTNALVKYDAETGKILIKTTANSKKGTVKVEITYPGQSTAIKKSFSIAVK